MDIDMAKPAFGGRMEDDLIDFDTDMVDTNEDSQKQDDNLKSADREMQENEDAVNRHAYETNGITNEDVDFDLQDVEDTANHTEHVDYELSEAHEFETQESAQQPQEDAKEHEDNIEVLDEIVVHDDIAPDDHASAHEIDYEFEENAEPEEPRQDIKTSATSHATELGEDREAGVAADQEGHESGDHVIAPEQDTSEHIEEEKDGSNHDDQNETQSPEAGSESAETAAFGEAKAEDVNADEYDEYADPSEDNGEAHDEEHAVSHDETTALANGRNSETVKTVDAEDHDFDAGEHVPAAYNEHGTADSEHADHSATDEDLNGKADAEFPAITVQYKGDEFPLFSTTNNGFFADTSVLDEPLEKLLAGLRNELENELAEDDDLVLQVDELGLELAETTQGELMTNVTFRQILEIFDLLVKNQDPDSSRTLYAYLFTKPNTEKRLESLIDSATAGKGLDEVIHLFEAPMTVGTSMLETAATIDGVHEELDELDSPVDEEHRGKAHDAELDEYPDDEYPDDEHANLDGSALEDRESQSHEEECQDEDEQHVGDDHDTDERDDHDVTTETQIELPADASTVDANPEGVDDTFTTVQEQGFQQQNGKATSPSPTFLCCHYPDFCLCGPCVAEYIENHNRDESEYRKSLKSSNETMDSLAPRRQHPQSQHSHPLSDFSTIHSFHETDEFCPARAESEIDPFANLELDEDAELNGDVDLEEHVETQEEVDAEPEAVRAQTNDTGTTTTLREVEESSSFNVDLGAVSTVAETAEKSNAVDHDLDEIDWRDEPEADDRGPTSPSAAGKRSRGDVDDVDVEDEQEAKRRRP
ncbi:hypothetical protein F53441_12824 [Fusarium austroafricanum]|uniref:Uncharacterized protein n=1 Tax=Fusarium austroafricanum TaxID=2364996 RepID=A0A8H4JV73_9HYPO|nr:hypothetical protein F53441_12824 [Fusarium austroafricanum]